MSRGRPTRAAAGKSAGPVLPRDESKEDGRRSRWQAHREARRADLVEAAIRAVRRHGAGVGMDEIAAEAGTSKPVLYRHFADKADLYAAVGEHVAKGVTGELAEALGQELPTRQRVAAVIDAYLRRLDHDPEVYRFVVHRQRLDKPARQDPLVDYGATVARQVSLVIGERLRQIGLDSGAAEPWAYGIVGMVRAAGEWWLERRPMSRATLTEYLTELLWIGFSGMYAAAGVTEEELAAQPGENVRPLRRARPASEREAR